MTELRKCSRCRSVIELNYFGINRKGEYNKTCINCLDKKTSEMVLKLCVITVVVRLIKVLYQFINEGFIVKCITWKLNHILKNG